jgi:hypothetical protein
VFNAITSKLTPAGIQDPVLDSVAESMHGNVTTEEVRDEDKSDESPSDEEIRFSREFNNEEAQRSPRPQRPPQTGVLNAEDNLLTDPRYAFQSSEIGDPQHNHRMVFPDSDCRQNQRLPHTGILNRVLVSFPDIQRNNFFGVLSLLPHLVSNLGTMSLSLRKTQLEICQ